MTAFVQAAKSNGKSVKEALAAFNVQRTEHGRPTVRRVRLLNKEADMIRILDGVGRAYKAYSPGDNHRIEIYETPTGAGMARP